MQLIENLTGADFSEAYMNDLKELCLLVRSWSFPLPLSTS